VSEELSFPFFFVDLLRNDLFSVLSLAALHLCVGQGKVVAVAIVLVVWTAVVVIVDVCLFVTAVERLLSDFLLELFVSLGFLH